LSDKPGNVCVTITTGRSGSTYLHNLFRHNYPEQRGIFHESLHPGKAKPARYQRVSDDHPLSDPELAAHLESWDRLLKDGPVVDFGWILGWLAPALRMRYGDRLRVLVLTAHPLSVAASFANRGHYTLNKNPEWAISPHHDRVIYGQRYAGRWSGMSSFEKGLYRWLETTRFGLDFPRQYPEVRALTVTSGDVFSEPSVVESIADLIGLPPKILDYGVDRNESARQHVERRPVGSEWKRIYDMPEVVELAQLLGFDMSESALSRMIKRYQPQGVLPNLRHLVGYWPIRERLGRIRSHWGRSQDR